MLVEESKVTKDVLRVPQARPRHSGFPQKIHLCWVKGKEGVRAEAEDVFRWAESERKDADWPPARALEGKEDDDTRESKSRPTAS